MSNHITKTHEDDLSQLLDEFSNRQKVDYLISLLNQLQERNVIPKDKYTNNLFAKAKAWWYDAGLIDSE